ncbi:hypothetical protein GCM10020331_029070 [Ectobacillus funiculus]
MTKFHTIALKTEYYALVAGTTSDTHVRMAFPDHSRLEKKYGEAVHIDLEKLLRRTEERGKKFSMTTL